MNGIQNKKAQNIEKEFPGCLGRMVNFFDLSNGISGNRLLTDKPHRDASSLLKSRSDVTRMLSVPFGDQIEDKMIISELRRSSSNKKANGTPMKALIAQELSKELESKHNPPNLVAKLMGLDTLPCEHPTSTAQRSDSKGYSRRSLSHSGILLECWEQDQSFPEKRMQYESHRHQEQQEYKDVYEIWQQTEKKNVRDSSPEKGGYGEIANEKKMAIIRQKFMELKRLSTDEKGRQTQEFQDALDVLNSNRDLFVKLLEEKNSMFSQHLYNMQSIPVPPETKRITVLRPSKVVDNEKLAGLEKISDKQTKKPSQISRACSWNENNCGYSPVNANQGIDEYPAQPTRIVVLKPSPGKTHDIQAVVSPPSSSLRTLHGEDFCAELENVDARESIEEVKEITRQMSENLTRHRRDETLISSVFSNGYIGDDSSINRSENEYDTGNLSDSEIVSPTSRHSWEYVNRFGSPYSSSFSHASCSPESSVCREAKKRLSERWAMVTSNGNAQEQRNVRRSSSTLGEMLAISDVKTSVICEEERISKVQEPRGSTSFLTNNLNKDGVDDSPKTLLRSKSVPLSSTLYGEVSDAEAGKSQVPKELTKAKSMKSSLKGKVSSLFFSRNKKSNKEKPIASQSKDESIPASSETPSSPLPLPGKINDGASQCPKNDGFEVGVTSGLYGLSSKTNDPDSISVGTKKGIISQEGGLLVSKPVMPGNMSENQDQPSPISVLEPLFEEDDNAIPELSSNIKTECWGNEVTLKSNLIDKSPPIGSIARTLSWDDSCSETAAPPYLSETSPISSIAEEEEDCLCFVQTLLSAAGLDGKGLIEADLFPARWHSSESPLDPALRDRFANVNGKELLHEAKRRQRRSNRKLMFDCVNAALMHIAGYGLDRNARTLSCMRNNISIEVASHTLMDHVCAWMKEWFCSEVKCMFEDGDGDGDSMVVEKVVGDEVVGKGWANNLRLEFDNVGKEIEGMLLEELVEEAVVDLTGIIIIM